MDKLFSAGQALSLLGSIVLLNGKLDDLVNNCALDDLYCYDRGRTFTVILDTLLQLGRHVVSA